MTSLHYEVPAVHPAVIATAIPSAARVMYQLGQAIFTQGDPSNTIIRVEKGLIRLSVLSPVLKEAVVTVVHAGDYFGEACLAGERRRQRTAIAITACTVTVTDKHAMAEALRTDTGFAACFLHQMLRRNMRLQNQLVDQLLNSSEQRLARALILLARFGATEDAPNTLPKVSQSTLAAMVGTTRSRVNFFLNKFRRLGFIEIDAGVTIKSELLAAVTRN